jgi:arylsulfatase A-like enzyme
MWISRYRQLSGTHRPEGIFLAAGPGIRQGRIDEELRLIDVAPTVLAHLRVAIPEDTDGQVLSRLFVEPPTPHYAAVERRSGEDGPALSDAEEAVLAERLRSLGYMD